MVSPVVFLGWMKLTCGMFFHRNLSAQFGGVQGIDQFAPCPELEFLPVAGKGEVLHPITKPMRL
jgi:hypothetical protein